MTDGRREISLAGALGVLLEISSLLVLASAVLLLAATTAEAAERPGQARIDLYDAHSNRTGHVEINERTGRVDIFDKSSRRTGSGTLDQSGTLQLFDLRGNRVGAGQVAPGQTRPEGRR
jgi:hypothetical protein